MSHEIVDLLTKINNNGTTVVMVTHEHELVRSFQRRVIVIQNGEVVSDTPDPTYAQFKTEKTEEVTDMYYFEESVQNDQVADVFENIVSTSDEEEDSEEEKVTQEKAEDISEPEEAAEAENTEEPAEENEDGGEE